MRSVGRARFPSGRAGRRRRDGDGGRRRRPPYRPACGMADPRGRAPRVRRARRESPARARPARRVAGAAAASVRPRTRGVDRSGADVAGRAGRDGRRAARRTGRRRACASFPVARCGAPVRRAARRRQPRRARCGPRFRAHRPLAACAARRAAAHGGSRRALRLRDAPLSSAVRRRVRRNAAPLPAAATARRGRRAARRRPSSARRHRRHGRLCRSEHLHARVHEALRRRARALAQRAALKGLGRGSGAAAVTLPHRKASAWRCLLLVLIGGGVGHTRCRHTAASRDIRMALRASRPDRRWHRAHALPSSRRIARHPHSVACFSS
ncbi:hypothetical protein BVI434_490002 [Burkholderia vietnamiensis]|nr:hypothetical protein BVI434_490002 [Burkholderia vietnamiensis]